MIRFFRLLSLSVATLAVARGSIPSIVTPIVAFPTEREGDVMERCERLRIGSRRDAVLLLLGEPDVRANDDHWIYWNFGVRPGRANPHGFDALVVSFTADAVSRMKLVDAAAIRRFLAQPRLPVGQ